MSQPNSAREFLSGYAVFELVDAHGVNLGDLLELAAGRGVRIQWILFISRALEREWNPRTILAKIEEAAIDCTVSSEQDHALKVVHMCRMNMKEQ